MQTSIDHLHLDGIDRRYPDRLVLRDVSLTVPPGDRVALVGENGSGKSTLLRIAAGIDEPDAGTVRRPHSLRLVHQELPFPGTTTLAEVLAAATAEARRVETALTAASARLAEFDPDSERGRAAASDYAALLTQAELTDVWSLDSRVDRVVAGLGLDDISRTRRVDEISGGQRSRLALASALVAHPVALLLDEPTNHLDAAGIAFLADELRAWRGPVLFATHDRSFIDGVGTMVVDLDPTVGPHRFAEDRDVVGVQGTSYRGGYTDHLSAKAAARRRWAEQYADEQDRLRALRHEVAVEARNVMHTTESKSEIRVAKKFYADRAATTIARRVRSARARLEHLERTQVARPPDPLTFAGFTGGRSRFDDDTVVAELVDVSVGGRLVPTSLTIHGRERLLVSGPNGCGKSTLLAVLSGALATEAGTRRVRHRLRIGVLAQDVVWERSEDEVVDLVSARLGVDTDEGAERLVASGLVAPRDLRRPVGTLSVGQQRRVALACLTSDPPDLLVLDEPTNHLSLALSEELEAALPTYPGAVVVASHDRWLAGRWTGDHLPLHPSA